MQAEKVQKLLTIQTRVSFQLVEDNLKFRFQ